MKNYITFILAILATVSLFAQASKEVVEKNFDTFTDGSPMQDPTPYIETITAEDLRGLLTVIASDEYEGRETGTEGNKKAALYIADKFRKMGLPQIGHQYSYFQKVAFTSEMWTDIDMTVNGNKYRHLWDFYSYPTRNSDQPKIEGKEVVFIGYGIDDENYSDYDGVDVKDKIVLAYMGEPKTKMGISHVTGKKELSDWSTDWRKKVKAAHLKGAKAVVFIDGEVRKNINDNRKFLLGSRMALGRGEEPKGKYANSVYVSTNIAKDIIGKKFKKVVKARKKIEKKGAPKSLKLSTDIKITQDKNLNRLAGDNVLGYIEGTDPELKDELIVLSAHYDHLGKRGNDIYNGADDNGSGTSSVIEVAEALAEAKKKGVGPRRSVLVMLVTGEEKGLLGSKYYVENPLFPIKNTIANVNVDMVGRVDDKYKENPEYIYVIGSDRLSTELHTINESVNEKFTNLILDYTYNAEDDPNRYYYRSDHYNFAEKGIPAIFYFNGTHKDYHRTSDTVEKINFEKMEKIARLVFTTVWELANREKRIEVDVK